MTDPNTPGKEIETPVPGEHPEVAPLPAREEPAIVPQEAPPAEVPDEMPDLVPDEQPFENTLPGEGGTTM